jgi:hypothetical protein
VLFVVRSEQFEKFCIKSATVYNNLLLASELLSNKQEIFRGIYSEANLFDGKEIKMKSLADLLRSTS